MTRTGTKKAAAKTSTKAKAAIEAAPEKMSALDAAARVLQEKGISMTCPELIGVMATKGYWSSPGGKTPAATLASAIIREITTKGSDSRFAKTAPGRFAAKGSAVAEIAAKVTGSAGTKSRKKARPADMSETPTSPEPT